VRILLATDGEEPSRHATELLARLADPARCRIDVLSVNSFEVALREAAQLGHYSAEAGRAHAERAVAEALTTLRAASLESEGRVVEGDEATEILAVAEQEDHGLIVVGTAKERWVDVVVLGSVSGSIVHASRRPVLVVHTAPPPDRVVRALVATDGSPGAARAVDVFAAFADASRCEVRALSVAKPVSLPHGAEGGPERPGDVEAATRHAEEAAAKLREAGFVVETAVERGRPSTTVLDAARAGGADLVVVGARGLGRFASKVLGSVSDRVVRKAPATLIGR
jgi:nucleotide-binding universal stress UspA family protein